MSEPTKATEEAPGVSSSGRIAMLSTLAVVLLAFAALVGGVVAGKLTDIPAGVITFGSLLVATTVTGKVVNGQLNE